MESMSWKQRDHPHLSDDALQARGVQWPKTVSSGWRRVDVRRRRARVTDRRRPPHHDADDHWDDDDDDWDDADGVRTVYLRNEYL